MRIKRKITKKQKPSIQIEISIQTISININILMRLSSKLNTDNYDKKTAFKESRFGCFLNLILLVLRSQPGFLTFVLGGK